MDITKVKPQFLDIVEKYETILTDIQGKWNKLAEAADFECGRCARCCELTPNIVKPLEAAYLKQGFMRLLAGEQRLIIDNCFKFKKEVARIGYAELPEIMFPNQRDKITAELQGIPCPLFHGKNICMLYWHRPISCRTFQCFSFSESAWTDFFDRISFLEFQYYGSYDYIVNFKNRYLADVILECALELHRSKK